MCSHPSRMCARVQVGVEQDGQHDAAFAVDHGALGGDEGACPVVELDVVDDDGAGQHVSWTHGTAEPQISDAAPGNGRPAVPHCVECQPLQDRQRVDSTGDQATELAVLRRRPVDVKPLGIPVGGEVDEFGLGHRV